MVDTGSEEREKMLQSLLRCEVETAQHHFCLLLVKSQVSPDSKDGGIDPAH